MQARECKCALLCRQRAVRWLKNIYRGCCTSAQKGGDTSRECILCQLVMGCACTSFACLRLGLLPARGARVVRISKVQEHLIVYLRSVLYCKAVYLDVNCQCRQLRRSVLGNITVIYSIFTLLEPQPGTTACPTRTAAEPSRAMDTSIHALWLLKGAMPPCSSAI